MVALGVAFLACLWQASRASSAGGAAPSQRDELSLLQVPTELSAELAKAAVAKAQLIAESREAQEGMAHNLKVPTELSAPKVPTELDKQAAKATVAKYNEQAQQLVGRKEAQEVVERQGQQNVSRPVKKCTTTTTTRAPTTTTTTSTYKPLPKGAAVAFTTANVTGPDQGYDVCFDPLIDEQRGFTLDLFIGNLPDQNSVPHYNGTVIASKLFYDPHSGTPPRGDKGFLGWALIYYKQAVSYTDKYLHPFVEFKVSSGGKLFTTRQYLPENKTTIRVTVSYNGPHYKRVRINVDKEEAVMAPLPFPVPFKATLSPQDMLEDLIPATTACLSIQKISPQRATHKGPLLNSAQDLSFRHPFQGTVGGVTFYHGQVTTAHLRDYYATD